MLSPDYILQISEGAEEISSRLHEDIINRIVERIVIRMERGDSYRMTAIDKWQIETLKDAGVLEKDIMKEIAKRTKLQRTEIKEAFEDAGVKSSGYEDEIYEAAGLLPTPLLESPHHVRLLQRNYEKTLGEFENFTGSLAREAQQAFIRECDNAYTLVSSGTISLSQAVREAVNRLANDGIRVHYPSGRSDSIETATLRAVRTGVSQACAEVTDARMEEMDWDIILVSSHLGARYTGANDFTNHMWWQGKFYSKSGKDKRFPPFSVCGYGNVQGICGANCRHSYGPGDGEFNPYDQFDDEENKRAYDLSQEQRARERQIRESKRKAMAIKSGRDAATSKELRDALDLDYQKTAAKLQAQNKAYKEFCEKNDLKPLQDRLMVAKWDREQAAQARGAAARYKNTKENAGKSEKNKAIAEKTDIETIEIDAELTELTKESKNDIIKSKWDNGLQPRGQVEEKISEDQLYEWVANDIHTSKDEAEKYVDSVLYFTDQGYTDIRRYQRGEPLQFMTEKEAKLHSNSIEMYIQKAPRWNGGTTYRGSTISDKELSAYKKGFCIDMGGTSSWSKYESVAEEFSTHEPTSERPNSVIYHCETQSKGTGIKHLSVYESEDEVLSSKESKYEIVKTEIRNYITHVYLKEV